MLLHSRAGRRGVQSRPLLCGFRACSVLGCRVCTVGYIWKFVFGAGAIFDLPGGDAGGVWVLGSLGGRCLPGELRGCISV